MSNAHILQTVFEGFMILAIIFGFIFEDRLIAFEERLIKRIRRKRNMKRNNIVKYVPHENHARMAR